MTKLMTSRLYNCPVLVNLHVLFNTVFEAWRSQCAGVGIEILYMATLWDVVLTYSTWRSGVSMDEHNFSDFKYLGFLVSHNGSIEGEYIPKALLDA